MSGILLVFYFSGTPIFYLFRVEVFSYILCNEFIQGLRNREQEERVSSHVLLKVGDPWGMHASIYIEMLVQRQICS